MFWRSAKKNHDIYEFVPIQWCRFQNFLGLAQWARMAKKRTLRPKMATLTYSSKMDQKWATKFRNDLGYDKKAISTQNASLDTIFGQFHKIPIQKCLLWADFLSKWPDFDRKWAKILKYARRNHVQYRLPCTARLQKVAQKLAYGYTQKITLTSPGGFDFFELFLKNTFKIVRFLPCFGHILSHFGLKNRQLSYRITSCHPKWHSLPWKLLEKCLKSVMEVDR